MSISTSIHASQQSISRRCYVWPDHCWTKISPTPNGSSHTLPNHSQLCFLPLLLQLFTLLVYQGYAPNATMSAAIGGATKRHSSSRAPLQLSAVIWCRILNMLPLRERFKPRRVCKKLLTASKAWQPAWEYVVAKFGQRGTVTSTQDSGAFLTGAWRCIWLRWRED